MLACSDVAVEDLVVLLFRMEGVCKRRWRAADATGAGEMLSAGVGMGMYRIP